MLEPTTIAIGLSSFLGGIASGIPGNLAGKAVDKVGNFLTGEALVRSAGRFGMATNHDAERAVRRAQMASLKCLLNAYYGSVPAEDEANQFPPLFIEAAFRFANKATARCDKDELALKAHVLNEAVASLDSALARAKTKRLDERARALRGAAEQAAFDELKEEVGKSDDERTGRSVTVPESFRDLFFHGRSKTHGEDDEIVGWYDGFVLFAADSLKGQDAKFRAIYEATRLGGIAELAFDTNEIALLTQASVATLNDMLTSNAGRLANLESLFARSVEVLRQISNRLGLEAGQERIEETLRDIVDRLTQKLDLREAEKATLVADLARIREEFKATESLLAGFLEIMVGQHVPTEQFAATLFKVAAEWRLAGERIDALSISRDLTPRIADLRDRAREAFAEERIADVERLLVNIDHIEAADIARLEAYQAEVRTELTLRRQGFAETKKARLAFARSQLRHNEAAALTVEIVDLTEVDSATRFEKLRQILEKIRVEGDDLGLNSELGLAIALARLNLIRAQGPDQRGVALTDLGLALWTLGERESGNAKLEEAVQAYGAALEETTRERDPLDWARTQMSLGLVLATLGGRESGAARLEEAVWAYRAALEEYTRERVPLDWAKTQVNLGSALGRLGVRESESAKLQEAVHAYRAALEEYTRHPVPLLRAKTQNGLGAALTALGEREIGTARLEEAVAAYRSALEDMTRERSAPMGGDAGESRHCACRARRAREWDVAASCRSRRPSLGAGGDDARTSSAPLGSDA